MGRARKIKEEQIISAPFYDSEQSAALCYLHDVFPDVKDDVIFYSNYKGETLADLPAEQILIARDCERACIKCKREDRVRCKVADILRGKPLPVLTIAKNVNRDDFLMIAGNPDLGAHCKFEESDKELRLLFQKSGLTDIQLQKSFVSFKTKDPEAIAAMKAAIKSASDGTNLIIGGRRGTGKTHLAISMAISIMRSRRIQARFEVLPDMLFSLRRAIAENGDFFSMIDNYKTVPVLVLDDFGKEKQTDSAMEYLFQVIDYRYRNGLQTILTTNAESPGVLVSWSTMSDSVAAIISRLFENGEWVSMINTPDYRMSKFQEGLMNA